MFSYPLNEAKRSQRDVEKENRQFKSRWTTVTFSRAIPEEHRDPTLRPCAKCGAAWYAAALATPPNHNQTTAAVAQPPALQRAEPVKDPEPETKRARVNVNPDVFWERLSQLMAWNAQGLLTSAQFDQAKQQLGL